MSDFIPRIDAEGGNNDSKCGVGAESRMGLAARRAAQLPKLRDLMRKQRPDSMDMDMLGGLSAYDPDLEFIYSDSDSLRQEISELYSYSEEDEFLENADAFSKFAEAHSIFGWSRISSNLRHNLVFALLEELELCNVERRRQALQCLLYLLQGNFLECESEEDFVKMLTSNVYLLYECGAWSSILTLFLLEYESPPPSNLGVPGRRASLNITDCRWIRVTISCLYTMLEVMRRDDSDIWRKQHHTTEADIDKRLAMRQSFLAELGHPPPGCDQCLAAMLFEGVTRYCTSAYPHYPIKKILLLLWKLVLVWLGDFDYLKTTKNSTRLKFGLTPCEDTVSVARTMEAVPPPCLPSNVIVDLIVSGNVHSNNVDGETTAAPPGRQRPPLAKRQLACMTSDSDGDGKDDEGFEDVPEDPITKNDNSAADQQQQMSSGRADSPRPTMSPPPPPVFQQPQIKALAWSLKVRPKDVETFLERERAKFFKFQIPEDKKTLTGLPRPILDSFDTLNKHLYVSLADKQIEREELLNKYYFSHKEYDDSDQPEDTLPPAELLYRSILPQIPQYVIGLLKILLAGVPTSKPKTDAMNLFAEIAAPMAEFGLGVPSVPTTSASANVSFDQTSLSAKMNLEVNRHKEIFVKAISGLLLLLLKHFKLNHVYQFEYVSQHLVFANCIPLILKFFDQNIFLYVQSENEVRPASFPTSMLNYAKTKERNPQTVANWFEDNLKDGKPKQGYFLWRNLFSAVNLLRILNKLTKWKHARTMMLVVFKSAPVLKRALRVKHILLQLYALKLLKMQAKYLGRQWRKTNMELMSAIYNKVRHRLNDNWAYGNETQAKPWDFQAEEASLREAVEKFNLRRYKTLYKLEMSGSSSPSNSSTDNEDDFKSIDCNVVSVLGVRYELTEKFKMNYERWLEHEVFKAKIDWDLILSSTRADSKS